MICVELKRWKHHLKNNFQTKSLGLDISWVTKVAHGKKGLELCQRKHV